MLVSQAGNITVDLAYRSLPSYSGQLSWVDPFAPFAEEAVYPRRVEAYKPISFFNEGQGLSAAAQQYDATSIINDLRHRSVLGERYRMQMIGWSVQKPQGFYNTGATTNSMGYARSSAKLKP